MGRMQLFVVNCFILVLTYFSANILAVEEFLFCSENVSILKIVCCETSFSLCRMELCHQRRVSPGVCLPSMICPCLQHCVSYTEFRHSSSCDIVCVASVTESSMLNVHYEIGILELSAVSDQQQTLELEIILNIYWKVTSHMN